MDKEQSAVKSFLEGTSNESMFDKVTDPFEIPIESTEEVIVLEDKEEKPIPFNKDPKVLKEAQALKAEAKRLEDYLEDIAKNAGKPQLVDDLRNLCHFGFHPRSIFSLSLKSI